MSSEPCLTVALFNKPNPQQPLSRYNFFASMYESHLHILARAKRRVTALVSQFFWQMFVPVVVVIITIEPPRSFGLLGNSPMLYTHSRVLAHSHCPAHLRHCFHTSGTPAAASYSHFLRQLMPKLMLLRAVFSTDCVFTKKMFCLITSNIKQMHIISVCFIHFSDMYLC